MNDELRSEVLRRRYGGQSGRDIARELHLSRKTVAKVLIEHRQQRVVRQHQLFLDFLSRAVGGQHLWMPRAEKRAWHHAQALQEWY